MPTALRDMEGGAGRGAMASEAWGMGRHKGNELKNFYTGAGALPSVLHL